MGDLSLPRIGNDGNIPICGKGGSFFYVLVVEDLGGTWQVPEQAELDNRTIREFPGLSERKEIQFGHVPSGESDPDGFLLRSGCLRLRETVAGRDIDTDHPIRDHPPTECSLFLSLAVSETS